MPPRTRHRWRRLAVQTALALLAWVAAPGQAQASCGDYVHIAGDQGAAAPDNPAAPCRGPECSHPSSPLLPPAPPAANPHTPPDAILAAVHPPAGDRSAALGPDSQPVPAARPAPVFRPPRAA
jgi:hypothetical protein